MGVENMYAYIHIYSCIHIIYNIHMITSILVVLLPQLRNHESDCSRLVLQCSRLGQSSGWAVQSQSLERQGAARSTWV